MSHSGDFAQFFDRISTRSVSNNKPIESFRSYFLSNPRGLSCDQDFDEISSSVNLNLPTQAFTEEHKARLAGIEELSKLIEEIQEFQNSHPNLPEAQASALRSKLWDLRDEHLKRQINLLQEQQEQRAQSRSSLSSHFH